MAEIQFDARDQALLDELLVVREQIARPRLGDYVRFPTGEVERFSHDYGQELQTSPAWAGSYYLHSHGDASFSGGLNPPIPRDSLSLTEESRPGEYWFFHHGAVGAGRGVRFSVPCRVYATTAEYQGFLTRPFKECKSCGVLNPAGA